MASKIEDATLAGLRVRGENIGFSPEEMIACESCGKPNPPNRVACLYCAAVLDVPETVHGNLKFRQLESWEKGFNIVVVPDGCISSENAMAAIVEKFSIDNDLVVRVFEHGRPFPVARLESARHAVLLTESLAARGVNCLSVPDSELPDGKPPIRLRGIKFDGDKLTLIPFNSDQAIDIPAAEIELMVTGAIIESRTEATHRRKRGKNEVFDEVQAVSHEPLIDLYTKGNRDGYRIRSGGFDFSCLAENKSIVAAGNLRLLVSSLIDTAPDAKVVDDYLSVRRLLDDIWEPETRRDSLGVQRAGMSKVNVNSVSVRSNLQQFTKYSRLLRHLL